jgi:diguanylate cyclase (GGDEF)-like protein
MSARLDTARNYFARQADPYAGGDMGNAQRLGAVLWALVVGLTMVLWISSPPNEAIGPAGFAIAAAISASGVALVAALRHDRVVNTWGRMLAVSYAAVIGIAILQWLSGGVGSPDERMLLLPVLFVAMIHPPRRIAAFMGFVALAAALPFIYDGWDREAAGAIFATFVIWSALSVLGNVLMTGVRAQRLAAAAEEAEAREEARVDKLTGLYNRRAFDEALVREVERSRRSGLPLCVVMVDIHDFKQINDGWGHAEGDRCLREVAAALKSAVRRPDLCFRWGGDEFALILGGAAADSVGPLGVRLASVVEHESHRPDHEPIEIAFAVTDLGPEMAAEELAAMAGLALTAAKTDTPREIADPRGSIPG